ncbi:hypothetical protein AUJ63_04230 [Candidatus Pacearchaeota archaeon CG1_02_35_32]|nr:MAG: hypothetical protein AUJ63_04230 [Candidatus Pacearchaeota archaeon CG1_02_35_32]
MSIEKVKMLKTVQAGRECWEKGTILPIGGESLHPIILQEIIQRTGTVEVLSYKEDPIKKGSKLKTPLDNNSLLEAQRKERELNERLNAERVKAEEAVLMSKKFAKDFQETKEVLEGIKMENQSFASRLQKMEKSLEGLKSAFSSFEEKTKKSLTEFEKRVVSDNSAKEDKVNFRKDEEKETLEKMRERVSPVKSKKIIIRKRGK